MKPCCSLISLSASFYFHGDIFSVWENFRIAVFKTLFHVFISVFSTYYYLIVSWNYGIKLEINHINPNLIKMMINF